MANSEELKKVREDDDPILEPVTDSDPGDEDDFPPKDSPLLDPERTAVMLQYGGRNPERIEWVERVKPLQPSSQRFHDILHELGVLHDKKALDYGVDEDPLRNVRNSEDFGVPAWVGCMIRANDKMKRIQSFANKGSLKNESLQDSLLDLAVYSVIALVLLEEEHGA